MRRFRGVIHGKREKEDVRKTETELEECVLPYRICICNCYVNTDH